MGERGSRQRKRVVDNRLKEIRISISDYEGVIDRYRICLIAILKLELMRRVLGLTLVVIKIGIEEDSRDDSWRYFFNRISTLCDALVTCLNINKNFCNEKNEMENDQSWNPTIWRWTWRWDCTDGRKIRADMLHCLQMGFPCYNCSLISLLRLYGRQHSPFVHVVAVVTLFPSMMIYVLQAVPPSPFSPYRCVWQRCGSS